MFNITPIEYEQRMKDEVESFERWFVPTLETLGSRYYCEHGVLCPILWAGGKMGPNCDVHSATPSHWMAL